MTCRNRFGRFSAVLVLSALAGASSSAWVAAAEPEGPSTEQRVGAQYMRAARARIAADPLTVESLEAAVLMVKEALALDPENLEMWRTAMEIAMLAEDQALLDRAVEKVAKLDPTDEVARLMRLNAALERYQTAQTRIAALEKLLSPENQGRIGGPVASRLAADLALLYRRTGELDQFAQWLGQAVALDPANRSAAALAAGFYRMNVQDAFGEAELLVNLMLADPTELVTQVALAQLLLEHGAYQSARRLYQLATETAMAANQGTTSDLLADYAIAQWACGDERAALDTVRRRQVELDVALRARARAEQPTISEAALGDLVSPLEPVLATVQAAIHAGGAAYAEHAPASLALAVDSNQLLIDFLTESQVEPDKAKLAEAHLQIAWITLWLGGEPQRAVKAIEAAETHQPLSDQAKQRFEGWIALRQGKPEQAIQLLSDLGPNDSAARAGLASALLAQGQAKPAAREFLALSRAQPGSLIGVWAGAQLAKLIGQNPPPPEQAAKLDQLINSIPAAFFRYPTEPSLAVSLRLTAPKLTFAPYEPIFFDLEITNNSQFPLGIDRDGPIRSHVAVLPSMRSAYAPRVGDLKPIMVNIGRRLSLMPRETMVVRVDLRSYGPADIADAYVVHGSIIRVDAFLNFSISAAGVIIPSILGSEARAPLLRVEGERTTNEWLKQVTEAMKAPTAPGLVQQMAILSRRVAPQTPRDATDEDRQAINSARTALVEAFNKLDPLEQAWLLGAMPGGLGPAVEGVQGVVSAARRSEHRLVRLSYLIYHTIGASDPMLDAAIRGEDPVLRRIAQVLRTDAERLQLK